jgi:hypothetical protein
MAGFGVTTEALAPVRGKEARQVDDVFHLADSSKCICSSIPFAFFRPGQKS